MKAIDRLFVEKWCNKNPNVFPELMNNCESWFWYRSNIIVITILAVIVQSCFALEAADKALTFYWLPLNAAEMFVPGGVDAELLLE